jgi:hypothetical protein
MKNLVRFAVAGALMAGFATAHAAAPALPSSGNADLWLFVSDASAGSTFAEDTGISLSSILPTASLVSGATLATSVNANFNLGASSALTSYINTANAAGQTLNWGVLGAQDNGGTTNTLTKKAGAALEIGSAPISSSANLSQLVLANLEGTAAGFNNDAIYMVPGYASGGTVYSWSSGSNTGNVWGSNTPPAGSVSFYGQGNGATQAGIGLGSSTGLYGFTGNGGTGQLQSYILGDNLTLSSTGALSVSSATSPVPLPAAVWLFGSGLLGLLGVGRRRAATQA